MKDITLVMKKRCLAVSDCDPIEYWRYIGWATRACWIHWHGKWSTFYRWVLLDYLKNSNNAATANWAIPRVINLTWNPMEPLLTNFKSDPSLIRHNDLEFVHFAWEVATPTTLDWRMLLAPMMPDFSGKLWISNLLQNTAGRSVAIEFDLPKLMIDHSGDDSLVHGAALSGLLELAQDKTSGNALPVQDIL